MNIPEIDLPHTPSSPGYLHAAAKEIADQFAEDIKKLRKGGLKVSAFLRKTKYGAKLTVKWIPRNCCKCEDPQCLERRYAIQSSDFRVKNDFGLAALKHFLSSQLDFARQFVP